MEPTTQDGIRTRTSARLKVRITPKPTLDKSSTLVEDSSQNHRGRILPLHVSTGWPTKPVESHTNLADTAILQALDLLSKFIDTTVPVGSPFSACHATRRTCNVRLLGVCDSSAAHTHSQASVQVSMQYRSHWPALRRDAASCSNGFAAMAPDGTGVGAVVALAFCPFSHHNG